MNKLCYYIAVDLFHGLGVKPQSGVSQPYSEIRAK